MQANKAVLVAASAAVAAYAAECDKEKRDWGGEDDDSMVAMFESDKSYALQLLKDLKKTKDFSAFAEGAYDQDTVAREALFDHLERAGLAKAIAYAFGDEYDRDCDPASGKSVEFLPPPTVKKGQIWLDLDPRLTKKVRTLHVEARGTKQTGVKCRVFENNKDTGRIIAVKLDQFRPDREEYRLLNLMDLYNEIQDLRSQLIKCKRIVSNAASSLSKVYELDRGLD